MGDYTLGRFEAEPGSTDANDDLVARLEMQQQEDEAEKHGHPFDCDVDCPLCISEEIDRLNAVDECDDTDYMSEEELHEQGLCPMDCGLCAEENFPDDCEDDDGLPMTSYDG